VKETEVRATAESAPPVRVPNTLAGGVREGDGVTVVEVVKEVLTEMVSVVEEDCERDVVTVTEVVGVAIWVVGLAEVEEVL